MSDFKDIPSPPPDDFSKTTPNFSVPDSPASPAGQPDWSKTNYNMPRQPAAPDEFGKTVTNIKPIDTERQDFGKTMYPGAGGAAPADWGATQANVNTRQDDFGSVPSDFGPPQDKTMPYFQLPEAERAKYQNLPPTPTEQAAQAEQQKKEAGGIPGWAWAAAGLMVMFFFAILVLGVAFFMLPTNEGFEAVIQGAPLGSDIFVDKQRINVTSGDGSYRAQNLKAGERTITIEHPSWVCQPLKVKGGNGEQPKPVFAECKQQAVRPDENCGTFQLGEEDKAERCYNAALDALQNPFTPEDLVKALNILIINFETSSFAVPERRMQALKKGAGFIMRLPPEISLEVGGHTDNVGSTDKNQTLSLNRANAVKDKLMSFGVKDTTLQVRGYGSTKPRPDVDANTDQGRFYNRRIEYSVVRKN